MGSSAKAKGIETLTPAISIAIVKPSHTMSKILPGIQALFVDQFVPSTWPKSFSAPCYRVAAAQPDRYELLGQAEEEGWSVLIIFVMLAGW